MIIVSQDKDGIINFENVVAIRLMTNLEDNKRNMIAIDTINGERYSVSKYDTEERAKEVLKEIVQLFIEEEMLHINKSSLNNLDELAEPKYILRPVSRNKVFYMPKE